MVSQGTWRKHLVMFTRKNGGLDRKEATWVNNDEALVCSHSSTSSPHDVASAECSWRSFFKGY